MEKYILLQAITKNMLGTLSHLLEKAEAFVQEKGIEEEQLLHASLAPDMFNFARQIQIASDDARRNVCFLAGKEHVKMDDTETTIAELKERVQKTREIVEDIAAQDFEGADSRKVSLYWMGEMYVEGKDFVEEIAIPNFLFHVVTAYDILRAQGATIGKSDFITKLSMKPKAQ